MKKEAVERLVKGLTILAGGTLILASLMSLFVVLVGSGGLLHDWWINTAF